MKRMLVEAGLVLEGGGTRCVFTAGILDYFMEQDLYIKNVYSVSGSAWVSLSYLSKQAGRTKKVNIDYLENGKIFSFGAFFRTKSVVDMKLLFDTMPNEIVPFDYDTFFHSEQKLTMSVSDMNTGKPIYCNHYKDNKHLMDMCKNSNSFPILAPVQYWDDIPVLDGGMADAIPIEKALEEGNKKNIIILTKEEGYRKKLKKKNRIISFCYKRKYPEFVKMVNVRPYHYNKTLDTIEKMDKNGEIFAIYPKLPPIKLVDRNMNKLRAFYQHGYDYAKELYPKVMAYLTE